MENFISKKIRITENTDPIGMPDIKEGAIYQTVRPETQIEKLALAEYPNSVLVHIDKFGSYRIDEVEYEYVDRANCEE